MSYNNNDFQFYIRPVTRVVSHQTMTVREAYFYITGEKAQEATLQLRKLTDDKEVRAYKAQYFDFACFGGTFSKRDAEHLLKPSGLLPLDFDHLTQEQMQRLNPGLCQDPHLDVVLQFISPSGQGIKSVVNIDLEQADYPTWFLGYQQYIKEQYGVEVDSKCKDICRACFLPYDAGCYVSPEALDPATDGDYIKSMKAIRGADYRFEGFDPKEWAVQPQRTAVPQSAAIPSTEGVVLTEEAQKEEVRHVAKKVVAIGRDITEGYDRWLKLGFALVEVMGEEGRTIFHELSRMNAQYNEAECDKQYTHCLNSRGSGVTIRSFFQMAKDAGVDLAECRRELRQQSGSLVQSGTLARSGGCPSGSLTQSGVVSSAQIEPQRVQPMPTFSDKLEEDDLCTILRDAKRNETATTHADMMMLGLMVGTSVVMPGICGIYDEKRVFGNLFCCIVAPPASSKGRLTAVTHFLEPIESKLRAQYQHDREDYEAELQEYMARGGRKSNLPAPKEPPYLTLYIPANSTSTAAYQALNDNGGRGMTFATEIDTMVQANKSDYGNYSDGLREAFQHEAISYTRRKDNEHVHVPNPRWSVLISGTPRQVTALIPDAENGLFSRFLFYVITQRSGWHNPFAKKNMTLDELYQRLGERYLPVYLALEERKDRPVMFDLTPQQEEEFNNYFPDLVYEQSEQLGDTIVGSIYRLGPVFFRFCMILTVLRLADTMGKDFAEGMVLPLPDQMVCDDRDFRTAMVLVDTLVSHTGMVLANLLAPCENIGFQNRYNMNDQQRRLLTMMGEEFTNREFVAAAKTMGIPKTTANRYLGEFTNHHHLLTRVKKGVYRIS